ncbi:MAG: cytochrome c [Alphaproteobacteria bacterium]|nr:cytochrome c [Alphaproteobacteria bacterium]
MTRLAPFAALMALPLMAACVDPKASPDTGAEDYAAYCSACHGATGKGDGEIATELSRKPADLTTLSARNKGEFPTTKVMAQIWGYAGAKGRGVMPDFGPLLQSEMVPYDGGDGIETPTPIRLVQLAEYLKVLQAK